MTLHPLEPSGSFASIQIFLNFAGGVDLNGIAMGYTMENLCDYLNLK